MSTRHAGYDNCKNVFIFYVVFLHLCNSNLIKWKNADEHWSSRSMDLFESYTLWHEKLSVPGFVFMSGFLGKGFLPEGSTGRKTDRRWEKTISVLLFGSGLVQLTYLGLGLILEKMLTERVTWSSTFPLWEKLETWYLIALFLWRLSTPLIGRLKWPIFSSFMATFICLHAEFQGPMEMRYVCERLRAFSVFIPKIHSFYSYCFFFKDACSAFPPVLCCRPVLRRKASQLHPSTTSAWDNRYLVDVYDLCASRSEFFGTCLLCTILGTHSSFGLLLAICPLRSRGALRCTYISIHYLSYLSLYTCKLNIGHL